MRSTSFKSSSGRRISSKCRALNAPVNESGKYFFRKGTHQDGGPRKLKTTCGKRRNSVCRPSKNDHMSYLHDYCPVSAVVYQDAKRYEKELWKCKRIYAKYYSNDRILLTPPMLLGRMDTNKVSPGLLAPVENISPVIEATKSNFDSEDSSDSVISQSRNSRMRRSRRKGRHCYKKSSNCKPWYLKNIILKRDDDKSLISSQRSFVIAQHGLQDVNSNYSINEKMDEINNNVIRNDKVLGSKMKMMADKRISKRWTPIEIPSSVENFSYPPEICPEYFYNWIHKLPIGKSKNYVENHYNCDVLYNSCCPCECQCPMEVMEGKFPDSKSKSQTGKSARNDRKIPNFEIKKEKHELGDCPDFHDVNIPKFNPKEFAAEARRRQAMIFCQRKEFALNKNRDPIFYKLKTTEVKPPSAERDYIWENSVKVLRMGCAKPEKFFIDDRKGSRHNFLRSGLAPIHITGDQYGKVPEYLEVRRKAQGLPPCDLSVYRIKKRCFKCGHDHLYCQHKKIEEEKIRDTFKNAKKNRYHSPGKIPSHYNDICCKNATWCYI